MDTDSRHGRGSEPAQDQTDGHALLFSARVRDPEGRLSVGGLCGGVGGEGAVRPGGQGGVGGVEDMRT